MKEIKLVFENCDSMIIPAAAINHCIMINKQLVRSNESSEVYTCDNFTLTLNSLIEKHICNNWGIRTRCKDRLAIADLTQVVYKEKDKIITVLLPFEENENNVLISEHPTAGIKAYTNLCQKTYINNNKNTERIKIVINK